MHACKVQDTAALSFCLDAPPLPRLHLHPLLRPSPHRHRRRRRCRRVGGGGTAALPQCSEAHCMAGRRAAGRLLLDPIWVVVGRACRVCLALQLKITVLTRGSAVTAAAPVAAWRQALRGRSGPGWTPWDRQGGWT